MADLIYEIGVDVNQPNRALTGLNQKVAGLSKAFGGLRSAIGGLAFGAAFTNVLRYADAISDVSNATDISIDTINKFGQAVQQSGGSIDGAQTAILKFSQTVAEARNGSKEATAAFLRVGLSIQDIYALDTEQLFKRTIAGLSQVSDKAEQGRLAIDTMGRSIRGTDFGNVQKLSIGGNLGGARTSAIQAAANAQDNLAKITNTFVEVLTNALEPLNKFIAVIKITPEQIERTTQNIVVGTAALFAFTKGANLASTAFTMFTLKTSAEVARGLTNLQKTRTAMLAQAMPHAEFKKLRDSIETANNRLENLKFTFGDVFNTIITTVLLTGGSFKGLGKTIVTFGKAFVNVVKHGKILSSTVDLIGRAFRSLSTGVVAAGAKLFGVLGVILTIADAANFLIKSLTGLDILGGLFKVIGSPLEALGNTFNFLTGVVLVFTDVIGAMVGAIGTAVVGVATEIGNALSFLAPFFDAIGNSIKFVSDAVVNIANNIKGVLKPVLDGIGKIFVDLTNKGKNFWDAVNFKPGATMEELTAPGAQQDQEFEKVRKGIDDVIAAEARRQASVSNAFEDQKNQLRDITKEYAKYNREIILGVNDQIYAARVTSDVGEQQAIVNQILRRGADDVSKLREQLAGLSSDEKLAGVDKVIMDQIAAIQMRAKVDSDRAKQAVITLQTERNALQQLQDEMERT